MWIFCVSLPHLLQFCPSPTVSPESPKVPYWAPNCTSFSQPISPPDMTPSSPHSQMTLPYWLVIQNRTSQPKFSNNTWIISLFGFVPGGSRSTRLNQSKERLLTGPFTAHLLRSKTLIYRYNQKSNTWVSPMIARSLGDCT